MAIELSFSLDEETAREIIEDVDEAVSSGDETWEFHGDFDIPEALRIRNDLLEQIDR